MKKIKLVGQIVLKFHLEALTGLHIGAGAGNLSIGAVEKSVVKDPITDMPYIPGSSLKGKMRSLAERFFEKQLNQKLNNTWIHSCGANYKGEELEEKGREEFLSCEICPVFGLPGERPFTQPTRLVVRDVPLYEESAEELGKLETELLYTEVKIEVSIDRITSKANPRHIERVPAGAIFGPGEMVYSIYESHDCDVEGDLSLFNQTLLTALDLLEKDYLGGMGSRGYGKVAFRNLGVFVRVQDLNNPPFKEEKIKEFPDLAGLLNERDWLLEELEKRLTAGGSSNAGGGV